MKYAILYSSQTGNTAALAQAVRSALPPEDCVHFGGPDPAAMEAGLVFVGFWTDKGTCDAVSSGVLGALKDSQVALFGTAGFGGEETYFDGVIGRIRGNLQGDNRLLGSFMCQGKMPGTVKQRFAALLAEDPENPQTQAMMKNFDTALSHPDQGDIKRVADWARDIWTKANA